MRYSLYKIAKMYVKLTFIKQCFVLFLFVINATWCIAQKLESFVEFGTSIHAGERTPMWQVSNQHGFSSINNNAYIRAGAFYNQSIHSWKLQGGIDMAVAAGFASTMVLQQAYIDARYKWLGFWGGSRELNSPLLNQLLSSGGLTWSGNARPVPQICIGILDYVHLSPGVQVKAEISYGWFTDGRYQQKAVGENYPYAKSIKYHHKSFFFRFGKPNTKWQFDIGMQIDTQFGGYIVKGTEVTNLGNSLENYLNALIPHNRGEGIYFDGNYLGSEYLKMTYKSKSFSLGAYLENFYEDFSGMGKQNGLDGLWGIEYKSNERQIIDGLVLEYYQSTNQSGPLHGLDFSVVKKTGGADNYYNHAYSGWTHWGMMNSNPLIPSNIYNEDGYLGLRYTRVKAIHLGWSGNIAKEWMYRAKFSFNQTWGTPHEPIPEILENFSIFTEVKYIPNKLKGFIFTGSVAFDTGKLYGDNFGGQIKIHKNF